MERTFDPQDGVSPFLEQVFGCSTDVALRIARRAVIRAWPRQSVILRQGDLGGETFLVIAGRAHALHCGPEGDLVLLQEYLTGDIFGAVACLDPTPNEADVTTLEETRTAMFAAADFLDMIERHGCVAIAVSRLLLRQLRAARDRIAERTTLSAAGRIHAELLRLAGGRDGRTVRPAPVLAALAIRVHSSRETVSRAINALERRGIIRRDADALIIVAPQRLEELIV